MKIAFREIPATGLRLEINDVAWFPDEDVRREGPARARIFLRSKGEERVLLTGEMQAAVILTCDRCLEDFRLELAEEFSIDVELLAEADREPVEHHCTEEEMDTMYVAEPQIDVYEVLAQQLFLLMPAKKLCAEGCRGLCPQCGTNLNARDCGCRQEVKSSPFAAALVGLKR